MRSRIKGMLGKVLGKQAGAGAPSRVKRAGGFAHAPVTPYATYSPWIDDQSFGEVDSSIRDFTLVDSYRCFELWQLAGQAAKLGGGDILEVGVWRGGTGILLAERARALGLGSTIFLCDTFEGVVKAGEKDADYRGGEHSDTSEGVVRGLIADRELENISILRGIFPEETGGRLSDRRFCLCHIDVDVYRSARDVFLWVWPRLLVGGVVVFDDYGFDTCSGITSLVEEMRDLPGLLLVHNLNGHAVLVKTGLESPE